MGSFASRVAAIMLAGLPALPAGVAAQAPGWHVAAEVATSSVTGGARSTAVDDDPISLRPHTAATYGVRLERLGARFGFGLAVRYSRPALAFEGPETGIIDRASGFSLYEFAPEVSLRLAGRGVGPALRLRAGPVVDVWSWKVTDSHTRLGGRAALGLDLPIGRRTAATIGGAATYSGSMFSEGDVAPDFETRAVVRSEVAIGLRYALR